MCCSCNSCCSCSEKPNDISGIFTQNIPVTMAFSLAPVNVGNNGTGTGISPFSTNPYSSFGNGFGTGTDSFVSPLSSIPTRTHSGCCCYNS